MRICAMLLRFATSSTRLEPRPLRSTRIIRLPRYYRPLLHPKAPSLAVTDLRLIATTDHALGLPVLRAFPSVYMPSPLPWRSHWVPASLTCPAIPAFPDRVFGSPCATSFSRLAQRSLALRPAHALNRPKRSVSSEASATSLPP